MAYGMDITLGAVNQPKVVFVVGAGGTGGRLIPPLVKILQPTDIVYVIDHDIVEPRNLQRQNFGASDIGYHKAKVMEQRYNHSGGPQLVALLGQVSKQADIIDLALKDHGNSLFFIFGCVDNDNARKILLAAAQSLGPYQPTVYIDIGNETRDGQAIVAYAAKFIITAGSTLFKQPEMIPHRLGLNYRILIHGFKRFPELFEETTKESEINCGQRIDLQTVAVNQMAATAGLNLVMPFVYTGMKLRNLGVTFSTYGTMAPILPNKMAQSEIQTRVTLTW